SSTRSTDCSKENQDSDFAKRVKKDYAFGIIYWRLAELAKEDLDYAIKKQDYQFEIDSNEKLTGRQNNSIVIPYNNDYTVSYKYQPESMKYLRFINNEPHIDAQTKKQLAVDNIIIQFAKTKIIDEEGRLAVDFIGKGKGLLFFKGSSEEIIWEKRDLESRTVFLDKEGNRIALAPGNVWIQIVPSDLGVQY
ncbi:MAG: DUF3048 C-terminal domain-containing protein, partial [Candidatus Atribacteria bacterium]|nr:DUF3048 C-terminal domain-containing protein [Candidatus Atribacteria bacterium]